MILLIVTFAFILTIQTSCLKTANDTSSKSDDRVTQTQVWLGTRIDISISEPVPHGVFEAIFKRISEIDESMSLQKGSSILNKLNNAAGIDWVQLPDDVFLVIQKAREMAGLSAGSFDPTIGPLVSAWDIGGNPRLPAPAEISHLKNLIDWRSIEIDGSRKSVRLARKEQKIDLGAIAKGYAADEAARICREYGVSSAILDLGGNIFVIGSKASGKDWAVGIQNPEAERGVPLGKILCSNTTTVTSGAYERYFEKDGIRYHHILDPATGYPSDSDLLQTTIISRQSSMVCDALSTATFVLGFEKAQQLLASQDGYEAVLVTRERKVWVSPKLRPVFTLIDDTYTVVD